MIVAVACVPQAPLLLPGVTGHPVPEVEELRAAARAAVRDVAESGVDEIVVLGAAPASRGYPPDAPAPAGRIAPAPDRRPEADPLPVALAVGRALLEPCPVPWRLEGIGADEPARAAAEAGEKIAARPGRTGLVVAADGSARRGEKAPGYVDPRAPETDARIRDALAGADTAALLGLDPGRCAELLIAGRAAWQAMAAACRDGEWAARLRYAADPFGVAYFVATWERRPANREGSAG